MTKIHTLEQSVKAEVEQWQEKLADQSAYAIMKAALNHYDSIAISFSGAEDVVLVHMAAQIKPGVTVFTLDTGRLHAETYQFIEKVRNTYGIKLKVAFPDAQAVSAMVNERGFMSFYQEGHQACCGIRKVSPLRNILGQFDAWITGQRRDQSPSTRQSVPLVQFDDAFSRPDHPLVKFNPLANWSSEEVWLYIRGQEIPYNPLHEQGYISIGCQPCTRPVLPGQHEREGRWWWEEQTKKECGLHASNLSSGITKEDNQS